MNTIYTIVCLKEDTHLQTSRSIIFELKMDHLQKKYDINSHHRSFWSIILSMVLWFSFFFFWSINEESGIGSWCLSHWTFKRLFLFCRDLLKCWEKFISTYLLFYLKKKKSSLIGYASKYWVSSVWYYAQLPVWVFYYE